MHINVIFFETDGRTHECPATWIVGYSGEIEITAICPSTISAGVNKLYLVYTAPDGSKTKMSHSSWNRAMYITAGEEFKLKLKFPEEMFTFVTKAVKKSWINIVYSFITKFRRNK
jgi:hypothetical protein